MSAKSKSLKEYLKRYESNTEKPIIIEEDNVDNSTDEEPQVDEDIEVTRMRRLEELKAKRPYNSISEDGSGWVSLSPNHANSSMVNGDLSPPRRTRARNDTPSPSNELKPSVSGEEGEDFSPPRRRQRQNPGSLEHEEMPTNSISLQDLTYLNHKSRMFIEIVHRKILTYHLHDSEGNSDLSPPRRSDRQASKANLGGNHKAAGLSDLSPPRRRTSGYADGAHISHESDLSPPRKQSKDVRRDRSLSDKHLQSHIVTDDSQESPADLSPHRKMQKALPVSVSFKQARKTGLLTQKEFGEEMSKTNKEDWTRFKEMNPSASSNAEPVYRDKIKGDRVSKEEFLKARGKIEEKPKEIKLEWGKGLAQKREAEAERMELELEKDRPFARSSNDAELDSMLRERLRWGDPMAHLVKKKQSEMALPDLGDSEKMKESGFIIPQDIPPHSWLKRGLDAAPNRYGIRPGRHWDGVDRSNGFEKQMLKRMNEKRATEREAYLWSCFLIIMLRFCLHNTCLDVGGNDTCLDVGGKRSPNLQCKG
ncbi:BUD13-like protein, partial [Cucurbita argyrosperma subsp. sororia]